MSRIIAPDIDVIALTPDRAAACEAISRALPDWFGIEDGLADLRRSAETQEGVVALAGDETIGFVTLTRHFPETWEVTWMAVHPGWRRRGLGGRLVGAAVARFREAGATTLLVKTLADSHPSRRGANAPRCVEEPPREAQRNGVILRFWKSASMRPRSRPSASRGDSSLRSE